MLKHTQIYYHNLQNAPYYLLIVLGNGNGSAIHKAQFS